MELKCFAASDSGLKRKHNEDAFITDPMLGFFAVADGMGGHAAGEVASRIAVDEAYDFIKKQPPVSWKSESDDARDFSQDAGLLKQAILQGNRRILSSIHTNGDWKGMGTTIVAAKITADRLTVGFVGDSRAYIVREQKISQMTTDHSWVNEQIRSGLMKKSDAEGHPLRNVITRALGISETVAVDVMEHGLRSGDTVILCSDGLNTSLSDHEILESILSHGDDLEGAGQDLIARANSNGGEDNTTLILIHIL